jgi:hypothetical protein
MSVVPRVFRYFVGGRNRLNLQRSPSAAPLAVRGRFSVDAQGRLIYTVEEALAWRREQGLPGEIAFTGTWRMDKDNDLIFVVRRIGDGQRGDTLTLRGKVITVTGRSIVFEMKGADKDGLISLQTLTLTGSWKTDTSGRLQFLVRICAIRYLQGNGPRRTVSSSIGIRGAAQAAPGTTTSFHFRY